MKPCRKNRIISTFVVVLLSFAFITPAFAQTISFHDVPANHFAFQAIAWVSNPANGALMVGDSRNNFDPDRHLTKFEAAQVFAMAAGFRHVTHSLPLAEREVFTRSFDTWRPLLDTMAERYSRWSRTVEREIAFLLYRGILTPSDVESFVTRTGQMENHPLLTRQEAVAWIVRLIGSGDAAAAMTLPHHTPFSDDNLIDPNLRRYIYYAKEAGIIQGAGGLMNPTQHFTRAEMAIIFFNALAGGDAAAQPTPPPPTTNVTADASGPIAFVTSDTQISITVDGAAETFIMAPRAVITIDNATAPHSALRVGMFAALTLDNRGHVVNLAASTTAPAPITPSPTPTPAPAPPANLSQGEGLISGLAITPQGISVRTQTISFSNQVSEQTRNFLMHPGAVITRGGAAVTFENIQNGDIVFFDYSGNTVHRLELLQRERSLHGVLVGTRPAAVLGAPILIIEETNGRVSELRVQPNTEIIRDGQTVNWNALRIGDNISATVDLNRLLSVNAYGERNIVSGNLVEFRVSEQLNQLTLRLADGTYESLYMRAGVHNIVSLRMGLFLRLETDSREATSLLIIAQ